MSKSKVIQRVIELKDKFTPGFAKLKTGTMQFKRDLQELKKNRYSLL